MIEISREAIMVVLWLLVLKDGKKREKVEKTGTNIIIAPVD